MQRRVWVILQAVAEHGFVALSIGSATHKRLVAVAPRHHFHMGQPGPFDATDRRHLRPASDTGIGCLNRREIVTGILGIMLSVDPRIVEDDHGNNDQRHGRMKAPETVGTVDNQHADQNSQGDIKGIPADQSGTIGEKRQAL